MKFLAFFALLFASRVTVKPHNDSLRAGDYAECSFPFWKALVS